MISAVSARVFLEGMEIFRLPDLRLQVVLENLEINLAVARQFLVIHLLRQFPERLLRQRQPACAGLRRNVVEQIVKPVIAQLRGGERLLPEIFVQIILEERVQLVVLRMGECGGCRQSRRAKSASRMVLFIGRIPLSMA